jgi:hypothetical protein
VFETLFQFLFDYRPHVFQQGDFRFAPPAGAPVVAVVLLAGLAAAFVSYRLIQSRVQWRERTVLGVLRLAALAIILFCIFRPVLVVKAAVVFVVMLLQSPEFRVQVGTWVRRPAAREMLS